MSEGRRFKGSKSIKNWSEYNEGLKRRYDMTVHLADESVFERPEAMLGRRGRPVEYSNGLIELGLMIKALYRLPYRGLEGCLLGLFKLGNYSDRPVPDYTTFCLRAVDVDVVLRLAERGEPINLLVDSTGVKIYGEGEWKVRQHGASKRRIWRKLHLGIDETTQEIIVADLTEHSVGDQEHLPDLLHAVPQDISIGRVTADGIYDAWGCYDAAAKHGAELITPPRKNAVMPPAHSPRSDHLRSDVIHDCQTFGRTPWKIHVGYHRRSLAEIAMYRFKISFGGSLFSRTFKRQKSETLIKAKTLNTFRCLAAPAY